MKHTLAPVGLGIGILGLCLLIVATFQSPEPNRELLIVGIIACAVEIFITLGSKWKT